MHKLANGIRGTHFVDGHLHIIVESIMDCSPQICQRFSTVCSFLPITSCVQLTFYRLVYYFDVRHLLGSTAQAKGDMFTPHVLVKQVASMSKATAHSLKSFNRAKGILAVVTQKEKNV
uniref:Uncharacterized protein n=1 Tax=Lactuca sativa TaxID=4236 RepID=A0A9R1XXH7_LACSA|nr:hypothetical protein LSAT_V11C100032420 [Lactuca sativa]